MTRDPATIDDRPGRPPFVPGTPEELDAVIAAPANHEVLFENDKVRVIRVRVQPGEMENEHTHKWPSVFMPVQLTELNYYNDKGEILPPAGTRREGIPFWVEPEGLHRVENISDRELIALRTEMKG